ncbi:MAG: thiamine ABC transporter substrate-binding protein [Candidatus Promineifilaceae bacterium]
MRKLLLLIIILPLLVGCGGDGAGKPAEVTLMTHDSFAASEDVLAQFEAEHNAKIVLLPAGDAGAALNQAILAADDPLADVFFGVDNTFLSRALEAGIFEAYASPGLDQVPDELELDPEHRLSPVDFGDVCLNYDRAWFAEAGQEPPADLRSLTAAEYRGLTVVENPATSSPGLAFLLATISAFGADGDYTYLDFWSDMRANDVLVTDGWEEAYNGQFSATGQGDRPLVVSYATSPPAEVIFAEPPVDEAPTAAITAPGTCFRQIEFAGLLRGAQAPELGRALIDFLLSRPFQEDIPLNMFVFPASEEADLPEVFLEWTEVPQQPATLPPEEIDAKREAWIRAWTDTVLR